MHASPSFFGAGLGFRRPLIAALETQQADGVDFFELAPENWVHVGGALGRKLRAFTERHTFIAHGLSLSLGGPAPLDETLLRDIKAFLDLHGIDSYSEHLSYCSDEAQLYDLMPIPFTAEAVVHVAARVRRAAEILERPIALENVSYYTPTRTELSEIDFVNAVLEEADCDLLLDVNNIFVNSVNHGYDAARFLEALPARRVRYFHTAGHLVEAPDIRVDTHGDAVCEDVWDLLARAYRHCGPVPTLVERDSNFPPLSELLGEVRRVRELQRATDI
ncbi:MAG TPA: DUF692 domain-containing protein [Steroidobacteraceae bacterium]|nr:DUF692 domain-containing protein [Steroidobacteraceae bacterium]